MGISHDRIHAVLIDVIMPKKNGKEAYNEMKKLSPGVKALFMSGYTADIIQEREVAGLDFIAKPILPSELLKKIREVLDKEEYR